MKSKISFFNRAIFRKNWTSNWPIFVMYLICLMALLPIPLALNCNVNGMYGELTERAQHNYESLSNILCVPYYPVLIGIFAIIFALPLFNYLYSSKSANMIHALPVDRLQLYGTHVLSGLCYMFAANLIVFLVTVLICLANGITAVDSVALWLLMVMALEVIFYSFAVFCAMLTGQNIMAVILYGVLNLWYEIFILIAALIMEVIGFGLDFDEVADSFHATWLSPWAQLCNNTFIAAVYEERLVSSVTDNYGDAYYEDVLVDMRLYGWYWLLIYLAVALVFLALGYLAYKHRKVESAGDMLCFSFLNPICRWLVGLVAGVTLGVGAYALLGMFNISLPVWALVVMILLVAFLFFMIVDMFIQKSFRVFSKKRVAELGAFLGMVLIFLGGMSLQVRHVEMEIPSEDEISYASISSNYYPDAYLINGDDLSNLIAYHQEILSHRDQYRTYSSYANSSTNTINIEYHLKNGKSMVRYYVIPSTSESDALVERIAEDLMNEQIFKQTYLAYNLGEITEFEEGWAEIYDDALEYQGDMTLSPEDCEKIYEAILADIDAIGAYDASCLASAYYSDDWDHVSVENFYICYDVVFEDRSMAEDYCNALYYNSDIISYSNTDNGCVVEMRIYGYVTRQCVNTIQALIDIGYIDSVDDLHWNYQYYEDEYLTEE